MNETETITAPPTSALDQLRSRREAITAEHRLDLDLPGYGGMLVGRYRIVVWEAIYEIQAKAKGSEGEAELNAAADLLIRSCERILMRDGEGTPVPLEEVADELGSEPVRFDENLARAVGVEDATDGTARSIVKAVLGNDVALIEHQAQVLFWIRSTDAQVDEDF